MMAGWEEKFAWPRLIVFMVLVFFLLATVKTFMGSKEALNLPKNGKGNSNVKVYTWCPLPDPIVVHDGLINSTNFGDESQLLQQQVERLSTAVNVATVTYDDNGEVNEDSRWQPFSKLHEVLKSTFPKVHEKMELELVNSYGLLYTLPGSSANLKPILFMAHQDVVPAADPSTWKHPPFEAHFDGRWLWGRGSVDCKNNLIAILSAMERLLEQGFTNKRTIIFSFGFDEETGGFRGGKNLAAHLQEKLGEGSIAMILDEGGLGIRAVGDTGYALPAVAEKGFFDIILTLKTPGGHSSMPPTNSGIGLMSRMIAAVEDHPLTPHLDKQNPLQKYLKCEVDHSPKAVEPWLKEGLQKGDDLTQRLLDSRGDKVRWLMQTSQSIDVIKGGTKDNQLPETVEVTINYRTLPTDKIDIVMKSVADVLVPIANQYNIAVEGPGYSQIDRGSGVLNISATNMLQASPLSPSGPDVAIWNVLASSIRQVFEVPNSRSFEKKIVPVGGLMTGNTDTAHYWKLSRNIYRFSPRWEGMAEGVHTVDERIDMRAHLQGLRFYYELMRNLDSYAGE